MTFDTLIDFDPVKETSKDPILPEERFVFELVGLEKTGPDQYHKYGGLKWSFLVSYENGQPFIFQNEQYLLWRTSDLTAEGKPKLNLGTEPHGWASALLGRQLGLNEALKGSELRGTRMSAQIIWKPKTTKPGEKAAKLEILRHVPVTGRTNGTAPAGADQVSSDPSEADVDRALIVTKLQKQIVRLIKLDEAQGMEAQAALQKSEPLETADVDGLENLLAEVTAAIRAAITA